MKYLLWFAVALLTACASTKQVDVVKPIRVVGVGASKQDAMQRGFREAVSIASGTVILSDVEIKDNTLLTDGIAGYSAGLVDKYDVVSSAEDKFGVKVTMDVWVRKSKMAEHKLNPGNDHKTVNGDRVGTQFKSFLEERADADTLIRKIVNDYPAKALEIRQGVADFKIDANRNVVVSVPFKLNWSPSYLVSLNEALGSVQNEPTFFDIRCQCWQAKERVTVISKPAGNWRHQYDTYYMNDHILGQRVIERFTPSPFVQATIIDDDNRVLANSCYISEELFSGMKHNGGFEIYGYKTEFGVVQFNIDPRVDISKANRVVLALANKC